MIHYLSANENEKLRARKFHFLITHCSIPFIHCLLFFVCFFLLLSCARSSGKSSKTENLPDIQSLTLGQTNEPTQPRPSAKASAILQTGDQPLWFQLTEEGPVHITSIEDAINSAALIPWPLAHYVYFIHEGENEIILVINRGGFIRLAPNSGTTPGIAMYRFSGGDFWRQYTLGGFTYYQDKPAALLYLDDIFLDSNARLPSPRTWTFNMDSNTPFPLDIPAFQQFPAEEGWDIDTLRPGSDGCWYYRAVKKRGPNPEIRMFCVSDLSQAGNTASLTAYQNSAPRKSKISHTSLPPLPKGFTYTGIGRINESLLASWEDQEEYSIGAAGFVLIKE